MIPCRISDRAVSFFKNGRPYTITTDSVHFAAVKDILLRLQRGEEGIDLEELVALADPKQDLITSSNGKLEFEGDRLVYGGRVPEGIWSDQILKARANGEPYQPLFLCLEDLMKNPDQRVIDRLPEFLEKSPHTNFLGDGRFTAFKGVRRDFKDIHSGTVLYQVGTTVSMPRDQCDPDPEVSCSRGLHFGTIDYITKNGYGWSDDRAVLLVGIWPRNVVAVPFDYDGGKVRACSMDVLEQVDQDFVDDLLKSDRTYMAGYCQPGWTAPQETVPAWKSAIIGDHVEIDLNLESAFDFGGLFDGFVKVVDVDEDPQQRLRVANRDGLTRRWIDNDAVIRLVSPEEIEGLESDDEDGDDWEQQDLTYEDAVVGDQIHVVGHHYLDDGWYPVVEISTYADPLQRLCVLAGNVRIWIDNDTVDEVRRG